MMPAIGDRIRFTSGNIKNSEIVVTRVGGSGNIYGTGVLHGTGHAYTNALWSYTSNPKTWEPVGPDAIEEMFTP